MNNHTRDETYIATDRLDNINMIPLDKSYERFPVNDRDREISLILWGFSLGYGFLTAWKAYKQTMKVNPSCRIRSVYVWLIWLDILGSFGFGMGAWFFMQVHVKPGFPLFLIIVISWAIQIQSQLQIIINRLSIIWINKKRAKMVRWSVFGLILCINIAVACIWIPTALQIGGPHGTITHINGIWDRIQKFIYLFVDVSLNILFVFKVKRELVDLGLQKYKPLADFNIRIIFISMAMDAMIIGAMFYPNPYVFMSFHPPAFLVKLNIEMSMAELILKIARSREHKTGQQNYELSQWTFHDREGTNASTARGTNNSGSAQRSFATRASNKHTRMNSLDDDSDFITVDEPASPPNQGATKIAVVRTAEVTVEVESMKGGVVPRMAPTGQRGFQDHNGPVDQFEDDENSTAGSGARQSQRIGHRVEVSTSQTELKQGGAPFGTDDKF